MLSVKETVSLSESTVVRAVCPLQLPPCDRHAEVTGTSASHCLCGCLESCSTRTSEAMHISPSTQKHPGALGMQSSTSVSQHIL